MQSETPNIEDITDARRKAITKSIRTIDGEELKKLGEQLFPNVDLWRDQFLTFVARNAGATFYHGATHDGIQVIYCPAKDKGIWFKPGIGLGPMQPRGRAILKQIVERR